MSTGATTGTSTVLALEDDQVRSFTVDPVALGLAPAKPGDILTIYATSLGATAESIAPGGFAAGASAVGGEVSIRLGGETLSAADVLYVGVSPGSLIYQVNLRVPRGRSFGNLPLEITVGGIRSPANAYLTVVEDGN